MADVISISRKKERIEKEAVVQLPDDVTLEILKRLPVRSLLRFRCSCKTWYVVISDPEFCNKLHQKRACVLICERPETFSTVTIESLLEERTPIPSTPVSFPWQPEMCTKFLGSSKGLVCVDYRGSNLRGLILWNPSTRKFRNLPPTSRVRNWLDENTYAGFGYHESIDDYKFVWMVIKDRLHPRRIGFDVFSLKSNTWSSYHRYPPSETILSGICAYDQKVTGVLLNGAIHWATHYKTHSSRDIRILALDLESDEFTLLETPCHWVSASYVVSLSGCLCLCVYYNMTEDSRVDLWMMKEYGVDSSWLKLVGISTLPTFGFHFFCPILFSDEKGKIVAMIERFSPEHDWMRETIRLRVEKAVVVEAETLMSYYLCDYNVVLHMEESLVSLN